MKQTVGVMVSLLLAGPAIAANPPASQTMPLEQRVMLLERKVQALSDMAFRLDALQREVQQLRGDVEVQNHNVEEMKQRQRALYLDIDQRLSQMKTGQATSMPPSPAVSQMNPAAAETPPAAASGVSNTPQVDVASSADPALEEAAYQKAFDILMQRRYADAKVALQQFLVSYPGGRFADNAQYWLAEASYVTRDFDTALAEFAKVLNQYPQSAKVPDARLKTGFILYEQKKWAEARSSLEKVTQENPGSSAARLAQQRLDRMRSEGH
jgi:tol-pal system protein YbgF